MQRDCRSFQLLFATMNWSGAPSNMPCGSPSAKPSSTGITSATHFASRVTDENLPRMGERIRLKRMSISRSFRRMPRRFLPHSNAMECWWPTTALNGRSRFCLTSGSTRCTRSFAKSREATSKLSRLRAGMSGLSKQDRRIHLVEVAIGVPSPAILAAIAFLKRQME